MNFIKNEMDHKIWEETINGVSVKFFQRLENGQWRHGFKIKGEESCSVKVKRQPSVSDTRKFIMEVSNI